MSASAAVFVPRLSRRSTGQERFPEARLTLNPVELGFAGGASGPTKASHGNRIATRASIGTSGRPGLLSGMVCLSAAHVGPSRVHGATCCALTRYLQARG